VVAGRKLLLGKFQCAADDLHLRRALHALKVRFPTHRSVLPVRHYEEADASITDRQAGDIVRKINDAGTNALRLEELGEPRGWRPTQARPSSLLIRSPLTLLNRVPS
jgi:hypothetical protein